MNDASNHVAFQTIWLFNVNPVHENIGKNPTDKKEMDISG